MITKKLNFVLNVIWSRKWVTC